jgi:ADP-ribosylglycohydrolase
MDKNRIAGCLFGTAFGDALGAKTEFWDVSYILRKFPPDGPHIPPGNPALVTDDTQMALAVGDAIANTPHPYQENIEEFGWQLRTAFVAWYNDPDNNRAPGNTCLTACENLIEGQPWTDATIISSKGCGANMRVQPVGVIDVDAETRAGMAQLQAAYTHGHPTGLAAADLTAFVIADLGNGGSHEDLAKRVREYALSQREVYHEVWLGDLWRRAIMMRDEKQYIARGWEECLDVIDRLDAALKSPDRETDPCLQTGAGWIAEEAFATGLLCFLLYPDDPAAVIHRAAVSSGDSDSIACIAGAFAGAYHGIEAWDADWVERIEYRDRIAKLVDALSVEDTQQEAT